MRIDGAEAMIALEREGVSAGRTRDAVELACLSGVIWITQQATCAMCSSPLESRSCSRQGAGRW
jgi:hypothetical protein